MDSELKVKYKEEIAKFREFCILYGYSDTFADSHFTDLSIGFFIALGVTAGTPGDPFSDAFRLASLCRYTLQYWEGETL